MTPKKILSGVAKAPGISQVIDLATNKVRLFLEYLLIGALLALAGAFLVMWLQAKIQAGKLEDSQKAVATLTTQNQIQAKALSHILKLRERDGQSIANLISDNRNLYASDRAARTRIKALEDENEAVRRYLAEPTPDALARMLNDEGPSANSADRAGEAAQAASGTVRATGKAVN